MENKNNGNILRGKNAQRDKNGKRQGFTMSDNATRERLRKIGITEYLVYDFLLEKAGSNFYVTIDKIVEAYNGKLSYDQVKTALRVLEKEGFISKRKIGYNGKTPSWEYTVYEVCTKLQAAEPPAPKTRTQADSFAPGKMDMSDFSPAELKQATAGAATPHIAPAQKAPAPIPSPPITQAAKQHIKELCYQNNLYSPWLQDKIQGCCSMWQTERNEYASDSVIVRFINQLTHDELQPVATVYERAMRS